MERKTAHDERYSSDEQVGDVSFLLVMLKLMNNINPVKIELPQEVVTLAIQANHLQKTR